VNASNTFINLKEPSQLEDLFYFFHLLLHKLGVKGIIDVTFMFIIPEHLFPFIENFPWTGMERIEKASEHASNVSREQKIFCSVPFQRKENRKHLEHI